jgi:hypothetical protein
MTTYINPTNGTLHQSSIFFGGLLNSIRKKAYMANDSMRENLRYELAYDLAYPNGKRLSIA